MQTKKAKMMRIYVGEDDDWNGEPLYHAIVKKLHDLGVAGCTVNRGVEGYGRAGAIHRAKHFVVSGDLPMTLVSTDAEDKIMRALPEIAAMIKDGIINLVDVDVVEFHGGQLV
jgi:PII-like signaling protein